MQAHAAGKALEEYRDAEGESLKIDSCFCSLLVRAERTLDIMATEMKLKDQGSAAYKVPVTYSWR